MKHLPFVRIARAAAYTGGISLLLAVGASAFASTPTVSIASLSPGNTVSVGTNMTFAVATTGFIDPYYSIDDTFDEGSLGSADLNSAGEFSWTPEQNDVGTHNVTVTAHDDSGDQASVNLMLTVTENGTTVSSPTYSLSIGTPYPSSTIATGQTVSFGAVASEFSETPSYTVTDSFPDSTVLSSDINSSGTFTWTPTPSDAGTHTLTVTASNDDGQSSSESITLYVTGAATTDDTTTGTAATTNTFTETLSSGSTGAQVTALQQLLIAQGDLSATATGYYGSLTEAAVVKFQAAHSIEQLGIVGPATRAALNALETPTSTPTPTAATTVTASTSVTPTITQVQSEIQSLTSQLTQIESQLSALVGQ